MKLSCPKSLSLCLSTAFSLMATSHCADDDISNWRSSVSTPAPDCAGCVSTAKHTDHTSVSTSVEDIFTVSRQSPSIYVSRNKIASCNSTRLDLWYIP